MFENEEYQSYSYEELMEAREGCVNQINAVREQLDKLENQEALLVRHLKAIEHAIKNP